VKLTVGQHIEASRLRRALASAWEDLAEVESGLEDDEPVPHEQRLALRRRVIGELEQRFAAVSGAR
jgi:hypothetical protein